MVNENCINWTEIFTIVDDEPEKQKHELKLVVSDGNVTVHCETHNRYLIGFRQDELAIYSNSCINATDTAKKYKYKVEDGE